MFRIYLAPVAYALLCVPILVPCSNALAASAGVSETWHLDGNVFDDGTTMIGSFNYNVAQNQYSDIEINTYDSDGTLRNAYTDQLPSFLGGPSTLLLVTDATVPDLTGFPVLVLRLSVPMSTANGTRNVIIAGGGVTNEGVCQQAQCETALIERRALRGRVIAAENFVDQVRWFLQDASFDDGAAATGEFSFATATQSVVSPAVITRAGSGAAGALYADIWPVDAGDRRRLRLIPDASLPDLANQPLLLIDWQTDTHAGGGTVNILLNDQETGQSQSQENTMCSEDGSCFTSDRLLVAGRAVAPLLDVRVCSNPAVDIPDDDAAGVTNALTLPFDGSLVDVNLELLVAHSFVGDLAATLTHVETGTLVPLIDRPGVPALDEFGCAGADLDALLSDESPIALEDTCADMPPALGGSLSPSQMLKAFDGENLAGTWQLNLSDGQAMNTGMLVEWCLNATVVSGPDGTDYDNDGVVDAADNCLLNEASQTDGDQDGIGNACDADLNNDCTVNVVDLGLLRAVFFTNPDSPNWNPAADLNDDGIVNVVDLGLMRARFFTTPGPTGVSNSCD